MDKPYAYILVCRKTGKCPVGLKSKDAEKHRIVCYNCRHCEEIVNQEYAGLGRM